MKKRQFFTGIYSRWQILVLALLGLVLISLPSCAKDDSEIALLSIDPQARFELSPYLYMQFMEPLGTTDGSIDAAWDFMEDRWRTDFIETTKELAPTMIRWGGCFCSYYRWKEGIGPIEQRPPMYNLLWGGIYNNQVGTHEFLEFCEEINAEPMICVNFESDGRPYWQKNQKGQVRCGTAQEAAEWVDYCNNPDNAERIKNGRKEPFHVKFWQIGNETHYGNDFSKETAARKTLEFARAMRAADPTIELIGWGQGDGWAEEMVRVAGKELQYLDFHQGYGPGGKDSPLRGIEYHKDWAKTWKYFMESYKQPEKLLLEMREIVADLGLPLVLTEGHFFLPGRNRNEALSTWAAGVSNARIMNMYERNGDVLKIATLADFCGTTWQNNAVLIPSRGSHPYMMPVAMVMSLYRKHVGENAIEVNCGSKDLDITASRTGNRVFLHVANINRTEPVTVRLQIEGEDIQSGKVFCIALDPAHEIFRHDPEFTAPKEFSIPDSKEWTFAAASVSAVELDLE